MRGSLTLVVFLAMASISRGDELRPVALKSAVTEVQPLTGIVLWTTNPSVKTAPIQLEYSYFAYDQVVKEKDRYDWSAVEKLLDEVAGRKHQLVLRWHDTYVGKPTGVPAPVKALPGYRETTGNSEKKRTGFPDWSHPGWQKFVPEFFTRFAEKYDGDRRLAYLEVGFGLWAEYHIYDGPMELGKTFPSKEFQREFAIHMGREFRQTPWMISVDAAGDHAPFAKDKKLLALPFGLFDDSFNHAKHQKENEPNWDRLGRDRWKTAPAGGEFSFFEKKDQKEALSLKGPHGIRFEEQAAKFHATFIIGDAQPGYQKPERIREAGMACGYHFRVTGFRVSAARSEVTVTNSGVAPIYFDAFPAVNGIRSKTSLKGLLPGGARVFEVAVGGDSPTLTIECDRLVKGQRIGFDAELP
ncbi:hypothetical protein [Zavarzinella formosa]|uniref:hypothetical protein n=1 Tax=Zavarzinella formosa TaxID=360055 RepID=UPI00030A43ED|nr:hypothetical protein [Zavarzinella formosa]